MIEICIVNYNCLKHTKNLISGLEAQTYQNYKIRLFDQGSSESGTMEYLQNVSHHDKISVTQNGFNKPLNHVWNDFASNSDANIISFLNNDILIPSNFLHDIVEVYKKEENVGVVTHVTNNTGYIIKNKTTFVNYMTRVQQGWDFSLLRKDWVNIPTELQFYCGDDWVYDKQNEKDKKITVITSSPIIHLLSQTREQMTQSERDKLRRKAIEDIEKYKKMTKQHLWDNIPSISNMKPQHDNKAIEKEKEAHQSNKRLIEILEHLESQDGGIVSISNEHSVAKQYCMDNDFEYDIVEDFSDLNRTPKAIIICEESHNLEKNLDESFDVVAVGGAIFIPWYENAEPYARKIIDSFLIKRKKEIVRSRPQLRKGTDDISITIICHKKKKPVKQNTKDIVVACVLKSGGLYTPAYVSKLASMVSRHTTTPYKFVCLTDYNPKIFDMSNIDEVIELRFGLDGWWSKLELFRSDVFIDTQVLYLDLDTLIVDNIDDILGYGGDFMGLRDFNTLVDLGSGILSWDSNKLHHVFDEYAKTFIEGEMRNQDFVGGDQHVIQELYDGEIEWMQDIFPNKMGAFKNDCYNKKSYSINIPDEVSVICFHGSPKMADLINDKVIQEHWK